MKKIFLIALALGFVLTSCEKKSEEIVVDKNNNTMVVGDEEVSAEMIYGTYEGILPCASCEGIKTVVVLNEDGTYTKEQEYLGEEEPTVINESGMFVANDDNTIFTLTDSENADMVTMIQVEDDEITVLNSDGTPVEGELASSYILEKK